MTLKISMKNKLGYSFASFSDACSYTFVSTFFLFFLTTIAGVNPAIAGTIVAVGTLFDAVMGLTIGFVSDNFSSRYGRRIPFIFGGAFPLAIAISLMFFTLDLSDPARILYYGVMTLVFWGSYATYFIPYMALGAELTTDYNERTVLRSYAFISNTIGMTVGMAVPTVIVDAIVNKGFSLNFAWQMIGIIVGLCIFLALMTSCVIFKDDTTISGDNRQEREMTRKPFEIGKFLSHMVSEYREVLKLKPLQILMLASILFMVSFSMNFAGRIYFLTYNQNLTGTQITIIFFSFSAASLLLAPVILGFSKIFDKKQVLIFGLVLTAILVTGMRFIGAESFLGSLIYCVIFSIANTSYWQLATAIIYDVCELDELINDKRREGAIVSLQSISEAISAAISLQTLGLILEFSGFDGEAAVQTDTSLFWLENSFSIVPALFLILAMIAVIKYPINKKSFSEILKQLEIKKEGGAPDMSNLKKMYHKR